MLPCWDDQGRITGLVSILYCLALWVAAMWPFWLGAAGLVYLLGAILLSLLFTWAAGKFAIRPSQETARGLFLFSVAYLPILLILMVADRR